MMPGETVDVEGPTMLLRGISGVAVPGISGVAVPAAGEWRVESFRIRRQDIRIDDARRRLVKRYEIVHSQVACLRPIERLN